MTKINTDPFIARPSIRVINIMFFIITGGVSLILMPIHIHQNGLSLFQAAMFLLFVALTGFSITMGYHRLFAHASYKSHPFLNFIYLFFGAAAFEQSALKWASQHRYHHMYSDTERDPYSPQKGFWHAHIGWLMFWRQPENYENVKDLQSNKLIANQHRFYGIWAVGTGIIFPLVLGAMAGELMGTFIVTVCFRIFFVHHATFCINSVCHVFGKLTYDLSSSARDHWMVALITFGEGYHNFHHRFPSDYRNGIKWYHWDPSKWLIAALSQFGLASDLKRVPYFRILHAQMQAENKNVQAIITRIDAHPRFSYAKTLIEDKFVELTEALHSFEAAAVEYQHVLEKKISTSGAAFQFKKIKREARAALRQKKFHFNSCRMRWISFVKNFSENSVLKLPVAS